jgi:hypothetical protein
MDEVKETDKTNVSVTEEPADAKSKDASQSSSTDQENVNGPPGDVTLKLGETVPAATLPASEVVPKTTAKSDQESELIALNGLLLVALAAGLFYVGTVVFAADSLLFFTGIFVYLLVAPPGTYVQGKSKIVSFTKEVAAAFGLTFVLFLILKAAMPADADQAKFFTFILFILGFKLVFFPYYNFKKDDDE